MFFISEGIQMALTLEIETVFIMIRQPEETYDKIVGYQFLSTKKFSSQAKLP